MSRGIVSDGAKGDTRRLLRPAERTPPQRDRWVDLLRAAAIVMGHWLASPVTYDGSCLGGVHALEVLPWAHGLS
ncbi:hypothetical protein [Actinomadura sp. SCN-SB]|uniref:hypothetical protein n=1 Tax=Actinomadura sp. SCN-SB TaxID=3373092 RepID=UPI0037504792